MGAWRDAGQREEVFIEVCDRGNISHVDSHMIHCLHVEKCGLKQDSRVSFAETYAVLLAAPDRHCRAPCRVERVWLCVMAAIDVQTERIRRLSDALNVAH